MNIRIDDNNELLCPACSSNYLHHTEVRVYSREEDAPKVLQTTVTHDAAVSSIVDSWAIRNPSARRDGLTIEFWCEMCHSKPVLMIAQHKGNTQLGWRKVE